MALNLQTQTAERQQLERRACDFPYVNPAGIERRHHWIDLAAADQPEGNAPNQAILKIHADTQEQDLWSAAPRGLVGAGVCGSPQQHGRR